MEIKPKDRPIREVLKSKKAFEIPRFQREYSWEKKHYQEFFEDIISNTTIQNNECVSTPYFMGTMLFVDDENDVKTPIYVVDGQQRLTTITIIFSALAQIFKEQRENILCEKVFNYIMTEDDNGESVRVLKTPSSYPYFSYYIQDIDKNNYLEASTEEEISIKETYDFFYKNLQEQALRDRFQKCGKEIQNVPYDSLLKAIRDQILDSTVIEIRTRDKKIANRLFEILNAKGKQLSQIDLIKNKIFEKLDETEPADYALLTWRNIIDVLNKGKERTGMATFFRHYWASKYKSITMSSLYDKFTIKINPTEYRDFLKDLQKNSHYYYQITNPSRELFDNKKQYYWLIQSLNTFKNYFNIVQIRVPLMALFDARERNIIDHASLKKTVLYLENFHFAYTAVLSRATNRIEPKYGSFSSDLRKAKNKKDANTIIENELMQGLEEFYPSFEDFKKGFVELLFSKKDHPCNVKTKYAINRLYCYFENKELFADDGSIEHIVPEADGSPLNIGNLILLENSLNVDAGMKSYKDKLPIYKKSKYSWIKLFTEQHKGWTEAEIADRAEFLADIFYHKVMGRK